MPHALILKYPGTNCDSETARALQTAGFSTQIQPIAAALPMHVRQAQLVVFAGGFSYGDYVMSGRLAQLETERFLGDSLQKHYECGGLLFGICNGFQILTKLGILPQASLVWNKTERFECTWHTMVKKGNPSPFTTYLPEKFELPSAHAEGRLVTEPGNARRYLDEGLVAFQYAEGHNSDGCDLGIAGLQDASGRVLGLMPHPERFITPDRHYDPDWAAVSRQSRGWGYYFFKGAFDALK
ncbi:MAG: phosphoribosylformylglycinamidine synthase subunit PurQ [Akkermansiaceae bacterium]|nr:phosphoribosylformylglycinamidine synthase subunit PurQ [Akkermansiaceae bacterium]